MAAHLDFPPTSLPFRRAAISGAVWGVLALLVVIGVAAFAWRVLAGNEHAVARAWHAFHWNWLFWSSVAVGMVVLAMAFHMTNARWSWAIRRLALAGVAFLPVSFLLFFVMWGGNDHYFAHWLHGHIEGDAVLEAKAAWLSLPGLLVRDTLALVVLFGMAFWFAYHMLRPDLYGVKNAPGIYGRFTGGTWRGVREEAARSRRIAMFLAPVSAILFAFLWGLIGIDQGMTMLPHWFSTMFPVTFLVSAFHSAIAMTAIMAVIFRGRLRLHDYITPATFHDLGKLVFAYAVFWMYVNWSQYVVIWYGLLPHEQEFFVRRFNQPFGGLTQLAVGCIFVIPFFFLLTRPPKKVPAFLAFVSAIVVIGHWLERFLITVPSVWSRSDLKIPAGTPVPLPLGLPEIGISLLFAGLFFACYLWFLKTFPVLPSPASLAAIPTGLTTVPVRTAPAQA